MVVLNEATTGATATVPCGVIERKPLTFSRPKSSLSTPARNRVAPGAIVRVARGGVVSGRPRLRNSIATVTGRAPGL